MNNTKRALSCSGKDGCTDKITHIDIKGYIYCHDHGKTRKLYQRCRQLKSSELKTLENGKQIKEY